MTIMLDIPTELEAQFSAAAQARGVPVAEFLRDFIVEHYREDTDDLGTAIERLSDPQPGLTSSQMRNNLGLDS